MSPHEAPLTFNGWRPDRPGWIFGLRGSSMIMLGVVAFIPFVGFWMQRYLFAFVGLFVWLVVTILTVWRPRGRPATSWAFAWALWKFADVYGMNVFESQLVSNGVIVDMDEPDLPGQLQRLIFHDGPSLPGHGTLGVVEDPNSGTWTFVARVTPKGLGLATQAEKRSIAHGRSAMLAGLGADGGYVLQVVEVVRTLPDDGSLAYEWSSQHWNPDAPRNAQVALAELMATQATTGIRTESFLAIQLCGTRAASAAKAAGGGATGYLRVAKRIAGTMAPYIASAGFDDLSWLSTRDLARVTKDALSPLDAASRSQADVRTRMAGEPEPSIPWAMAGPGRAVNEWAVYVHAGMATVTNAVALHPERDLPFDALGALMATTLEGEQRAIAVYHQPKTSREADKAVDREQSGHEMVHDAKEKRGFRVKVKERKALNRAERAEHEISVGHTLERAAVNLSVSMPFGDPLDDALEAALSTGRRFGMSFERMWGAQDSGFFATALPFALGLPPVRKFGK